MGTAECDKNCWLPDGLLMWWNQLTSEAVDAWLKTSSVFFTFIIHVHVKTRGKFFIGGKLLMPFK